MSSRSNRRTPASNRGRPSATTAGQLTLPLGKPPVATDTESIAVGRRVVTVRFVRHRRARRYLLRVLPDGAVRLTLPAFGSRAQALAFLRRELPWVDRQRYAAAKNAVSVLFRGEALALQADDAPSRAVTFGDQRTRLRPGETPRQAAVRHLRALAARDLPDRLRALADRHGLQVRRVTVRSQQTRWGSCSPNGAIALNWRLVQMPEPVRDYILIHELMHLRERNHGRRFWALVERACPDHRAARTWLKGHEGELA